jgi:hypothetical protein
MKSDALRTPAGLRMVILALVVHLALIIACFLFKVPNLSSLSFSLFLLFSSTKSQCRGFQITSLPPTASRKLLLQTSQFSKNWTRSQHSSQFVRLCCLTRKKMDLALRLYSGQRSRSSLLRLLQIEGQHTEELLPTCVSHGSSNIDEEDECAAATVCLLDFQLEEKLN